MRLKLRNWISLFSLVCISVLVSCTQSTFVKHPSYHTLEFIGPIALFPIDNSLIIHDQKSLSQRLNIQREYLYQNLVQKLNKTLLAIMKNMSEKEVAFISNSEFPKLASPEAFNLYGNTYVKVAWPPQGTLLQLAEFTEPHIILLLHEVNIGFGLVGSELYDYTRSNKEQLETSENFSIVISYSLWDNKKQQFIVLGYEESSVLNKDFSIEVIELTLTDVLKKIFNRTALPHKGGV